MSKTKLLREIDQKIKDDILMYGDCFIETLRHETTREIISIKFISEDAFANKEVYTK